MLNIIQQQYLTNYVNYLFTNGFVCNDAKRSFAGVYTSKNPYRFDDFCDFNNFFLFYKNNKPTTNSNDDYILEKYNLLLQHKNNATQISILNQIKKNDKFKKITINQTISEEYYESHLYPFLDTLIEQEEKPLPIIFEFLLGKSNNILIQDLFPNSSFDKTKKITLYLEYLAKNHQEKLLKLFSYFKTHFTQKMDFTTLDNFLSSYFNDDEIFTIYKNIFLAKKNNNNENTSVINIIQQRYGNQPTKIKELANNFSFANKVKNNNSITVDIFEQESTQQHPQFYIYKTINLSTLKEQLNLNCWGVHDYGTIIDNFNFHMQECGNIVSFSYKNQPLQPNKNLICEIIVLHNNPNLNEQQYLISLAELFSQISKLNILDIKHRNIPYQTLIPLIMKKNEYDLLNENIITPEPKYLKKHNKKI